MPNRSDYSHALSPDEKWFAHSGPGWHDPGPGCPRRRRIPHDPGARDDLQALVFNPDGTRLLGVDVSGTLKIWDFATGREVAATNVDRRLCPQVRFSRDGKRLAVVGESVDC